MSDESDLFEPVYSPRRVRFWLRHWEELETLAYGSRSAGILGAKLQREWWLLQSERGDCLCGRDQSPPSAEEPWVARGFYRAPRGASHIRADLERAANALPIHWQATRRVFLEQGRLGEWQFRHGLWQRGARGRPQDAEPEPRASYHVATQRMARALGWVPAVRGASLPVAG